MATTAYTRKPLLAYDRRTGELLIMMPSASNPDLYHLTTAHGCDCRGFQFRGECSHTQPRRDPAKGASLYAEIWGEDERPAAGRVPLIRYA